ncbi:hypothetical protein Zmor_012025 [Zophobas morio]|uniref:Uncharacterized protein n=1 Tax=Zophobas morio TaxID=2755281 RepID=A0AA38HIC1_9CUCU|nr:hypothetical protein Zmor_012025 [Zophobas morio]
MDQPCYDIDDAPYELHEIYADVHFILNNDSELVGFKPGSELIDAPLVDEGSDVRFVSSDITNIMELSGDKFALFMPGEGHAPKINDGKSKVTKIICKVK